MKIKISAVLLTLVIMALFALSNTVAVGAQNVPTPTPYPAMVMTATAAAQRVQQAQQAQSDAAQQEAQAAAARRQADADFDAAQQAANDARAALAAQQIAAAGEAIGRSDANIANGRLQLDQMTSTITQLRATVDRLAGDSARAADELQICRTDKQITLNAYTATAERLREAEGKFVIDPIIAIFFFIAFMAIVFGLVFTRWQNQAPRSTPVEPDDVIDNGYTVTDDDTDRPQE